jgi:hypothetical protein
MAQTQPTPLRARVAERLAGDVIEGRVSRARDSAYQEGFSDGRASEAARDGEDEPKPAMTGGWGYRTARTTRRDLATATQQRAIELSYQFYRTHPLAHRFIELGVCFVWGEGFTVASGSEDVEEVVKRFWAGHANNFPLKGGKRVRELALAGEQLYQAFVNDKTGRVTLGAIDPARIVEVVCDEENSEHKIAVKVDAGPGRRHILLRIIQEEDDEETMASYATPPKDEEEDGEEQEGRFGRCFGRAWRRVEGQGDVPGKRVTDVPYDGLCFYFTVNDFLHSTRGCPDLLPILDWLDRFDQMFFDELERISFQRAFIYDVTVEGGPEDVKRRRLELAVAPPRPGTVLVHNQGEKWQAVSPAIGSGDFSIVLRQLRLLMAAGMGYPEHFLAEGDTTNKATSEAMGVPTIKMLSARQAEVKAMCELMLRFAVDMAVEHGMCPAQVQVKKEDGKTETVAAREAFTVAVPELVTKDNQMVTQSLVQLGQAYAALRAEKLLPDRAALELLAITLQQAGVRLDVDKALEALEQAEEEAKEKWLAIMSGQGGQEQNQTGTGSPAPSGPSRSALPGSAGSSNGNSPPTPRPNLKLASS